MTPAQIVVLIYAVILVVAVAGMLIYDWRLKRRLRDLDLFAAINMENWQADRAEAAASRRAHANREAMLRSRERTQ